MLTVETGGTVTVRAVTPACMQPYKWESKPSWYDAKLNSANFLLLSQEPGYFTQFAANGVALKLLNNWYGPPATRPAGRITTGSAATTGPLRPSRRTSS